jgi:uncharacterized protein (TIGR00725 family)
MQRSVQIAVCGSSRSDPELDELAAGVGAGLARAGAVLVCGGGPGVMAAAAAAARAEGGEVIGILRGDDPAEANPGCTHVVATGIGQGRNLAVAASGAAVIAIGGEWGTLSEIAFARRIGRPVVTLMSWRVQGRNALDTASGIEDAADAEQAVRLALAAAAGGNGVG